MCNANRDMAKPTSRGRNVEELRHLMGAMYSDLPAEANAETNSNRNAVTPTFKFPRHPVFAGRYVTKVEHASPLVVSKRFVKPQMMCDSSNSENDSQPERLLRKLFCIYALRKVVLLITPKPSNSQMSDMYNIHAYLKENRWHLGVTSLTAAERDLFVHNQKPNNYALIFCTGYIQLEDAFMSTPLKDDLFSVLEQKSNAATEIRYRGKRYTLHYTGAEVEATTGISRAIRSSTEDGKSHSNASTREVKISARNATAEIRPLQMQNLSTNWIHPESPHGATRVEDTPEDINDMTSHHEVERPSDQYLDNVEQELQEDQDNDSFDHTEADVFNEAEEVPLEQLRNDDNVELIEELPSTAIADEVPQQELDDTPIEQIEESPVLDTNVSEDDDEPLTELSQEEQMDAEEPIAQQNNEQIEEIPDRRLYVNEELTEEEASSDHVDQLEEQQTLLQEEVDQQATENNRSEQFSNAVMDLRKDLQDYINKMQNQQHSNRINELSPEVLMQTKKALIRQSFKGQAYMAKIKAQQVKEAPVMKPPTPQTFNKAHKEKLKQMQINRQLARSQFQTTSDHKEASIATLEQMEGLHQQVRSNCSIGQVKEPSKQDSHQQHENALQTKEGSRVLQMDALKEPSNQYSQLKDEKLHEHVWRATIDDKRNQKTSQQDTNEVKKPHKGVLNTAKNTQNAQPSMKAIHLSTEMLNETKKALIKNSFKGQAYMAKKLAEQAKEVPVKKQRIPLTFNEAHKEKLKQLQILRQREESLENQTTSEMTYKPKDRKQNQLVKLGEKFTLQPSNEQSQNEASNATLGLMEEVPRKVHFNHTTGKLETSSKQRSQQKPIYNKQITHSNDDAELQKTGNNTLNEVQQKYRTEEPSTQDAQDEKLHEQVMQKTIDTCDIEEASAQDSNQVNELCEQTQNTVNVTLIKQPSDEVPMNPLDDPHKQDSQREAETQLENALRNTIAEASQQHSNEIPDIDKEVQNAVNVAQVEQKSQKVNKPVQQKVGPKAKKTLSKNSLKGQASKAKKPIEPVKDAKKPPVSQTFNKAHKAKMQQLQLDRRLVKSRLMSDQLSDQQQVRVNLPTVSMTVYHRSICSQYSYRVRKSGGVNHSKLGSQSQLEKPLSSGGTRDVHLQQSIQMKEYRYSYKSKTSQKPQWVTAGLNSKHRNYLINYKAQVNTDLKAIEQSNEGQTTVGDGALDMSDIHATNMLALLSNIEDKTDADDFLQLMPPQLLRDESDGCIVKSSVAFLIPNSNTIISADSSQFELLMQQPITVPITFSRRARLLIQSKLSKIDAKQAFLNMGALIRRVNSRPIPHERHLFILFRLFALLDVKLFVRPEFNLPGYDPTPSMPRCRIECYFFEDRSEFIVSMAVLRSQLEELINQIPELVPNLRYCQDAFDMTRVPNVVCNYVRSHFNKILKDLIAEYCYQLVQNKTPIAAMPYVPTQHDIMGDDNFIRPKPRVYLTQQSVKKSN